MPTQSTQDPGKGKPIPASPTGEELVTELIYLMHPFCEGKNGKSLKAMIQGHETLKAELGDLRTAYNTNLRALAQQQIEWDTERSSLQEGVEAERTRLKQSLSDQKDAGAKLNAEREKADSLRRQIQDNEQKIKALIEGKKHAEATATKLRGEKETLQTRMEGMGYKNNALKDELEKSKQQHDADLETLNNVQESLTTVRSFLVPLRALDETGRATIRDGFADLFHYAMDLCQSALYHDISEENMAGGSFQSHVLPLPASNSSAAKQIRVVAGLAACGKALGRHLFRDSFLTQSHELDEKLHLLATTDRLHHAYVRAALAKVLPTTQTQGQNRGSALAINEVMAAIGRWAPDERALRSGLESICDKALQCWALARQVEDRIWPEFEYELPEDWQPLPLPCWPAAPTVNTPNRKKMPKTDNNNSQNGAPNHETRQLLKSEVKVVWPTIFAAEPQVPGSSDATALDRLHCGYVLTQAQSQDAEEEISHRAARRTRRADSVPHKNRRNSGVFLSGGVLSGSSGK
ncbi:putative MEI5 protein [Beauveria bassiana ARSEF 2860]|uniref:Putative MEI5 protein n=1 Tax=Beauveria bassiana (strain ARSEF 2860) TaxID=655819 RepID=J5JE35_BEAB2|nr:putative MEI5 protein [Beauveria bassiana ARSEF 2860]EJP62006.1 putative MEI5 protein [Beauveria bassiana ARSEF 2860]